MPAFILGQKENQSQAFTDGGERIPTTFIKTASCYLVDIKDPVNHHYFALELGFGFVKNIKKPIKGRLTKAGIKTPLRFFREFKLDRYKDKIKLIKEDKKKGLEIGKVKIFVGDEVKPELFFERGNLVSVSGFSKGKGFQGVVKRHHFRGGPKTHGQSDRQRAPGAIGQTTTPGRVYKGKRMAGRMGGKRTTIKNLEVIEINKDGLKIRGLVPGAKEGLLEIVALL